MDKPARQTGFDNIKGILIILVVFGHFLELCPKTQFTKAIYLLIYSFHMPCFLFISGYFATYSPRRIGYLAIVYAVFQLLYRIFDQVVLGNSNSLEPLQILFVPYWLLWFIPVLIYCHLLLPAWSKAGKTLQRILFVIAVVLALLCGYCPQIGYPLSLSRFFVFLPFFLAGNHIKAYGSRIPTPRILPLLLLACSASVILLRNGRIIPQMLYGSYSYAIGYNPGIRLGILAVASVWSSILAALAMTVLNRPVPILSHLGKNTLPVYLLHGFIVRFIGNNIPGLTFPAAVFISITVVLLLGNPIAGIVLYPTAQIQKKRG